MLQRTFVKSCYNDGANRYQIERSEYIVGYRRFANTPSNQNCKKYIILLFKQVVA